MKTIWPIVLIAFFLASCGSDNPASEGSSVDDPSSGSAALSSGGHSHGGHHGSSSSSSVKAEPISAVGDSLIEDTTAVLSKNDLPACTPDKEGESFYVESEHVLYFCLEKEWFPSETVESLFKIGCHNGVLTLEAPGAEEEEEESSGQGQSNPWGFFNGGGSGTSALDTMPVRLPGTHIVGFAEKGPFRYGASVKIIELDSTQRLADSKKIHKTCITEAGGNFSFDSVDLVSPYLRVEANGYFHNELTGGLSSQMVTLKAVVDVTDRDTVNVNMLTHMEAPRVLKLVENSGNNQPIRAVKAQALKEILSSFEINLGGSSGGGNNGFPGWNFGGQQQTATSTDGRFAEDISLFDGDEYSAALLAVSIMMQRNGSGNDMLQYTSGIAERIKGNGNWDDNNAKADLADWLMVLDTSGSYATIRNNIASWKRGDVPDFEKHLRNFWTGIYQFGACNSMTAGTVKHVNNSLSKYFISYYEQPEGPRIRFICDAETHRWRAATDIEKDTVGFGKGDYDGQIKAGKINVDKFYVYEQSKGKWRAATGDDIMEFEDIGNVYASLAPGEKVIFILRHAERTDDTGKKGHLTDNGKKQAKTVGEKLKGDAIVFANSTYTRSYETCENVASGAGVSPFVSDTIKDLDGEWYVKDESKYDSYKNSDGGGWVVASAYAYKGAYADAFYDFDKRSEEFLTGVVKPRFASVNRVGVWISHDMFVAPITAYCTDKKVNLRYFDTKSWINYLAGVAIIMGTDGKMRYVPVKGLSSGTMTM